MYNRCLTEKLDKDVTHLRKELVGKLIDIESRERLFVRKHKNVFPSERMDLLLRDQLCIMPGTEDDASISENSSYEGDRYGNTCLLGRDTKVSRLRNRRVTSAIPARNRTTSFLSREELQRRPASAQVRLLRRASSPSLLMRAHALPDDREPTSRGQTAGTAVKCRERRRLDAFTKEKHSQCNSWLMTWRGRNLSVSGDKIFDKEDLKSAETRHREAIDRKMNSYLTARRDIVRKAIERKQHQFALDYGSFEIIDCFPRERTTAVDKNLHPAETKHSKIAFQFTEQEETSDSLFTPSTKSSISIGTLSQTSLELGWGFSAKLVTYKP